MLPLPLSFVSLTVNAPSAYAARSQFAYSPFRLLYGFKGPPDGAGPEAALIEFKGELYGTTAGGGANNFGTVFEIDKRGQERVLYSFQGGADGEYPLASLVALDGVLYGTTIFGGGGPYDENGTVFSVTTLGQETVLHRFQGGSSDGNAPFGSLVALNGKLYGTTEQGGAGSDGGAGTVFEVSKSGAERIVYSFTGQADGGAPLAGLIVVKGELYGTTASGGNYNGTVFKVNPAGKEQVVYAFQGTPDGDYPDAPLIESNGELYGTTAYGGVYNGIMGYGTVFEVSLSGKENVLHRFTDYGDGTNPMAPVTMFNGALYGTTELGGDYTPSGGYGTIFGVTKDGNESVLYDFTNGADGANPVAGLLRLNGRLYGASGAGQQSGGDGAIFTFKP